MDIQVKVDLVVCVMSLFDHRFLIEIDLLQNKDVVVQLQSNEITG